MYLRLLRLSAILFLCAPVTTTLADPLITEFMASNDTALYDEDGESSDWMEIHNPDAVPVDLGGYYLTNDAGIPDMWRFPAVTLPSGGNLIVFASNKDRDVGELHTDFRLSKDGGYLALVDPDGQTVVSEYANYPEQFDDFSYGLAQTGNTATTTLIPGDSACRYLVPSAATPSTWNTTNFDDDAWSPATTGIGYERSSSNDYDPLFGTDGDIEADIFGVNTSVYMRIPFSINDTEGVSAMRLLMKFDDGYVAFINGTEVHRQGVTGTPVWNGTATSHDTGANFDVFDISQHVGLLETTGNVLAIHGMNTNDTSSDLVFLPMLEVDEVSNPGLGAPGYFQQSTPGTTNGTDQGLPAEAVQFSIPGRGYTGSLSLSLSVNSPNATIRYTTNGNVPTSSSTLYTGSPISITSSTLVRARAFETGLAPGPVVEEGYIELASSAANFNSDLPVVVMEEFNGGPTAANGKTFAFFAFFEPDPGSGRTTLNKPYALGTRGGWKQRGSSSSGFEKKAYSIEAWNEFNRNKDISPLGMPEESDWILNARSQFDRSLMRNAFIYELSNQVGRYAVRTKFVELFLNTNGGNLSYGTSSFQDYDGVYTFMEKISRDNDRVDVERLPDSVTEEPTIAGGYMLKIDRADPGDAGFGAGGQTIRWVYPKEEDATGPQAAWIQNYINEMNASLSTPNYEDYINVPGWVDHHLLNVLALNADALRLSTYFFKPRHEKLDFGPIWDFDRSMESTDGRDDNPSSWSGGTAYFTYPWWGTLFQNENFWQAYIDRYAELRDGPFATANVHRIIDGMAAELNEAQVRNFQRFSDQPRFGSYQGEVNHLKNWLATRLSWMDGQFAPRPTTNRASGVYSAGTTVTLSAPLGGNQSIYYTLDGTDPRPPAEGGTVNGTTLFDESQPVRAFVPTSDIGTAWRTNAGFDDSGWLAGTNGVGYERSSGYDNFININVDTQMTNQTSCYIRIKFDITASPAEMATWNFLTLQLRYDDGFVAYLNGTQIASDRAPNPVAWNSSAPQTHDDGAATVFQNISANGFVNLLQPGENLLAIHALNESTGSSDFLNQSRLVAGFDENGGPGGVNGIEYTGPIVLTETARLVARVFDADGGHSTNSGQTPEGTGWSAPLEAEYLVNESFAAPGNLEIVEIMYDPYDLGDAQTGDSAFEWVELQNTSGGSISLTDVAFTDGIEFTFPGRSLGPGERVLVVSNRAAFEQVCGSARSGLIAGEYDGALNNGGETLTLAASSGAQIQSVSFPDNIAGNGFSLVANGVGGWVASRSILGSPGMAEPSTAQVPDVFVNEVLTNSVIPETDAVELFNPNAGEVNIGGWFLTDDLSNPEKFRIPDDTMIDGGQFLFFDETDFNPTPGVPPSFAFSSAGEEVFLIAATPAGERLDYATGIDFGDASAGVSFGRHTISTGDVHTPPLVSTTFGGQNSAPVAGPLVVNELMYNPSTGEAEFVEIRNISGSGVPLAGVEVSGIGWAFDAGAPALPADGIVLLVGIDPATFRATYSPPAAVDVFGPYPGRLDNGGERVVIRMPEVNGTPGEPDLMVAVDIADYDDDAPWPEEPDGTGLSLQRRSPTAYGSDPVNWEVSATAGGTPGTAETVSDWRAAFFTSAELNDPALSGVLSDADKDRLNNLLEYILGSDLRDATSQSHPEVSLFENGNGDVFAQFEFQLRNGVTEFSVTPQMSGDLSDWQDASGELTTVSTTDNGDGTSSVVMRTIQPITGTMHLRLMVEEL